MAAASTASPGEPLRAEPVWYVQAADKVWGPYAHKRLKGFVGEGRLTAQSLVASQSSGPFGPAGRRRELQALFPPEPALGPLGAETSRPQAGAAGAVHPLLVWAALASLAPTRFEALLAAYGPFLAIRPGLWLVRAGIGASPLRNALSRRLRSEDALLVVEAPLAGAAWFNLDGATERSLRQMWGGVDTP